MDGKDYRLLFLAVVAFLLLPVALVDFLPMVDVPGHLARIHILDHYAQDAQFRQVYEPAGRWIPNLTMDLLILPLLRVMNIYQASRVFVAAGMLVFALGCWTLSYSRYRRITPMAVLTLFLQYNSTFFYGFVAFQFGVGLALVTIGLWYRWRGAWTVARMALLALLAAASYLTHLGGYLYLGVGLGWLTLLHCWREKRISLSSLVGLLSLVPPVLIFLSMGKSKGQDSQIIFSTLPQKLRHAAVLLIGYDLTVDAVVALLLAAAAGAAWKYGKFRFDGDFGALGVVFAALFVLMPWWLLTGSDADTRMVLGAGVFLLLGLTCELPPTAGKAIYAVALTAFVVRIAFCGWVWTRQSEFIGGHVAFLNAVPAGARVYPMMHFSDDAKANKFDRVLRHVPDLATVQREAIVPTTFAVPGQHSIVERTPRWYRLPADLAHPEAFDWERVAKEYDVIWQFGADPALRSLLDSRFQLLGQYLPGQPEEARLYRIPHERASF